LCAAAVAIASVASTTSGTVHAATQPQYLFTVANSPAGGWNHLSPSSPVTQSLSGAAWTVSETGVDENGLMQYRLSNLSVAGTRCLDVMADSAGTGTSLTMKPCVAFSSASTQNWRLLPTTANGRSAVKLLHNNSGLLAGVRNGSTAQAAVIELQTDADQNSQKFLQSLLPVGT